MDSKTRKAIILALLALAASVCLVALSLRMLNKATGQLKVTVVDAYTLTPLEGAYVKAVECEKGEYVSTGFALITGIPIEIMQTGASYGEVTLIAYAEGYMPSILLRAHVYPKLREGPAMYMFPVGSEEDFSVTVFSEAPEEHLMEELAAKNRPSR